MTSQFIEVASEIGIQLCRQAIQRDSCSTWLVRASYSKHATTEPEPASPHIYNGTAGIAVFLAELFAITGEQRFAAVATSAVRTALAGVAATNPWQVGFHCGLTGVAYAAQRVGEMCNDESLCASARSVVASMRGYEHLDESLDVVGGAAGAIPILLQLSEREDFAVGRDVARALGDHLVRRADKLSEGWSWGRLENSVRPLTGFAHGASGVAHALLELAAITGDHQYRYAADRAILYERHYFDTKKENWLDFRNHALFDLTTPQGMPELRRRARAGETFAWPQGTAMMAWCHGAPGIGLVRLRSAQLFADDMLLSEARAAVSSTTASLSSTNQNYSLCHGHSGNAETLILATDVLGDTTLLDIVHDCFQRGIDRYHRRGLDWPSGVPGNEPNPSLLLGTAGVGYALLRASSSSVPSILLPCPRNSPIQMNESQYRTFVSTEIRTERTLLFANTLSACNRLGITLTLPSPDSHDATKSTANSVAMHIRNELQSHQDDQTRTRLLNAHLVDCLRLRMQAEMDWSKDQVETITTDFESLVWPTARFRLASRARVILPSEGEASNAKDSFLPDDEIIGGLLLLREGIAIRQLQLGVLPALILNSLGTGKTIGEVLQAIDRDIDGQVTPEQLRSTVQAQLEAAIKAGVVVQDWSY